MNKKMAKKLSSEAKEVKKMYDVLNAAPDIRTEKLESLKEAIRNGRYRIDEEEVAGQMIKDALQEFNK